MILFENDILLSRYLIRKEIGSGGFGRVYMATDLLDDSFVAVKLSFGDEERRKMNLAEAHMLRAFQNVQSPCRKLVVDMKTFHVIDDCVVVVMELLARNLLHYIVKCRDLFTFHRISLYARQMIEFLVFMKHQNAIHGDIKPENILVGDRNDKIKFADFGLSYIPLIPPVKKPVIIQSRYYRSPEVVLGYDYDASVDVWSTGCVLMECLTGVAIFRSKKESDLLLKIALLCGLPAQETIRSAPNRREFFCFDEKDRKWTLKGLDTPLEEPVGLKSYLERYSPKRINVDDEHCTAFLDFVGKMIRVEPCQRSTPEELFGHKFLSLSRDIEICQI